MATIVCQVQQQQSSCLESQLLLVEPIATTLRLKVSSSSIPSHFEPLQQQRCNLFVNNNTTTTKAINTNTNHNGGWSFLQTLSAAGESPAGATYVHPLSRRSAATILSDRSLELCTENLGNETGTTDTIDCSILSNAWRAASEPGVAGAGVDGGARREKGRRSLAGRTGGEAPRSFPPPLTTLIGKDSIRVKLHREDGRLVMKAVRGQSRSVSCFRADRSEEGRLRLCLLENYLPRFESIESDIIEEEVVEEEEEEKEKEEEKEEFEERVIEGESEKEKSKRVKNEKEKSERVKSEKFGIVRGGRCKESGDKQFIVENKSLLNWVAT